jgi:hypothetical protein
MRPVRKLALRVLPGRLGVCKLPADSPIPGWALAGPFFSVSRTSDELSIVCPEADIPADVTCERGWRYLRVAGAMPFSLTGVLAALAEPLAEAGIGIFAISTFDTDYLLVLERDFERALAELRRSGHEVE